MWAPTVRAGRCGGLLLPVDAHPELMYCAGRWHLAQPGPDLRLDLWPGADRRHHPALARRCVGFPQPAGGNPLFDDKLSDYYYNPDNPMGSVGAQHRHADRGQVDQRAGQRYTGAGAPGRVDSDRSRSFSQLEVPGCSRGPLFFPGLGLPFPLRGQFSGQPVRPRSDSMAARRP